MTIGRPAVEGAGESTFTDPSVLVPGERLVRYERIR